MNSSCLVQDTASRPIPLPNRPAPFVSVIVPVRNEARFIKQTLVQLLEQHYDPQRFEVIVSDGQSTDATRDIVRALQARYPNLRVVNNPKRWSSAGRNVAIGTARGELLVVVDGHSDVDSAEYLNQLVEAFARSGADCVGRPQPLDVSGATPLQRAIAAARSSRLGHHHASWIYSSDERFVPPHSVAVAYRREVFETFGLFDEDFDACEDVEFNHRIDRAGMRCFFTPKVRVRYHPRSSLGGLVRQMCRYGQGRLRLLIKHPETLSLPCLAPAAFVVGLIAGPVAGWFSPWCLAAYAGGLGLYLLTVMLTSVALALRSRDARLLSWLPLVFPAIHLGAGAGLLLEAARKLRESCGPRFASPDSQGEGSALFHWPLALGREGSDRSGHWALATIPVPPVAELPELPPLSRIQADASQPRSAGMPAGRLVDREQKPLLNVLTVDVEDYYHVSGFETIVDRNRWSAFESRVVASTGKILRCLEAASVHGTFFCLGWVAERHPELVRAIRSAGHEIGCHGYWHRLVYRQTPAEFRADLRRARDLLQEMTGAPVVAYRAPSFSITRRSLWALDILLEEGFLFDSSIYPTHHDRYGIAGAPLPPHQIVRPSGVLWEFPMAVYRCLGYPLPIGGGGYFRLYPYRFTRRGLRAINAEGRPFAVYLHPWELDPEQPRLRPGRLKAWRHYVNLHRTERRLECLLRDFRLGALGEVYADLQSRGEGPLWDLSKAA
jgi:polysaccharide deacetylase family protein (PEP-CTERM system associated)